MNLLCRSFDSCTIDLEEDASDDLCIAVHGVLLRDIASYSMC